ncbi:uncharacterized protein [Prorops nasuta]|uniref:uncharacterized protein n=1 Tax=Prorops nasuta TaxID=863751 RepID=UPI0034CD8FAF
MEKHDTSIRKRQKIASSQTFVANTTTRPCIACKTGIHPLFRCDEFKGLPPHERFNLVKRAKLCYNCMRSHKGKPCRLSGCTICSQRHNTLLHLKDEPINNDANASTSDLRDPCPSQLLTTAIVGIRDKNRLLVNGRVLLDTGATNNFISESMVKRLGIRVNACTKSISTIDGLNTVSIGSIPITIKALHNDYHIKLVCLIVPKISDSVPTETFKRENIKIPQNIKLADPNFHIPNVIDVLIGSGKALSLFAIGQIRITQNDVDLYLQKTQLGWVVAGGFIDLRDSKETCHSVVLENIMQKFWEVEEVGLIKYPSQEEIDCEQHYVNTINRDVSGRYIVRLPFRQRIETFRGSKDIAHRRLLLLERRMAHNSVMKKAYSEIIDEYIKLNHMSLVKNEEEEGYYMPHHAVTKNSSHTTKIRIVFDASAKNIKGVSLNDVLMVGPTIQDKLISHLTRFRMYNFIITADIEKMYRQVLVHKEDRKFQRILWRQDGKIKTFELNTLTFGISSSPFLAIRTLERLADDEKETFPRAAEILRTHLYVDDLLTGGNTIEEVRQIRDELIALLARGGFVIRQWAANDERIIKDLPTEAIHTNFILNMDKTLKTLGISWNATDDKICYTPYCIQTVKSRTKRCILSEIAKIFDPIGLLGPVILYLKRLMQKIWQQGLAWDESLPQAIHSEWLSFVAQWESMGRIFFDRKLLILNHQIIQLHGFSDASTNGYGACIYVRSEVQFG